MTDTRNGALSEQVAGADLDPRAKGFMEMLEKDENVPRAVGKTSRRWKRSHS